MKGIYTTLGFKSASELGMILPHEHVFVDLRTWNTLAMLKRRVET